MIYRKSALIWHGTSDSYERVVHAIKKLRRILDFERSRNQRRGSEILSREVDFMGLFPVAFLTNGVFILTHGGIELTTPVLRVRMLLHQLALLNTM